MKREIFTLLLAAALLLFLCFSIKYFGKTAEARKPVVVWYTVFKYDGDLLEKAARYRPDIVIISVFAEDDVVPLNGSSPSKLKELTDGLHGMNISVYYSYSVFSRSMYEEIKHTNLPVEQYLHVSGYAKYLRENDEKRYHELFDYYLEHGLDPEDIPRVERKPVDGFYVEVGHYSMIDPLYEPYRRFIIQVINETVAIAKPDGLAFDHIRFFTFDEGYNRDIRDFILRNFDFDIYNFTPQPIFQLDSNGWTKADTTYYDSRAGVIAYASADILDKFPQYKKMATTMGVIDPARSDGQYVELQARQADTLLLMAYDRNSSEVARNVRETAKKSGMDVILGISLLTNETAVENIKAGLDNRASGIYLLGYNFGEDVHNYLLEIRGIKPNNSNT